MWQTGVLKLFGTFRAFNRQSKIPFGNIYDEFGNVKVQEYDPLDRLTKSTLLDSDGAGSRMSPIYSREYGDCLLILKSHDLAVRIFITQYSRRLTPRRRDRAGTTRRWFFIVLLRFYKALMRNFEFLQLAGRACSRHRFTKSAILASPTHMTVSAPPQ